MSAGGGVMAINETSSHVRVFRLVRDRDITGYSGPGHVADGVVWPDGTVSLRWRGPLRTTVTADCIDDIQTIHGHDGATRVVWSDRGGAAWTAA